MGKSCWMEDLLILLGHPVDSVRSAECAVDRFRLVVDDTP